MGGITLDPRISEDTGFAAQLGPITTNKMYRDAS
jgi:hypothetical protein